MSIPVAPWATGATGRAGIRWAELSGVRAGLVLWGGLAVVDLGTLTRLPSYAVLGAVALLVTAASVGLATRAAVVLAAIGWLVVDGFVVHRYGVLGFDGAPDAVRLALLVALATSAARSGRPPRMHRGGHR